MNIPIKIKNATWYTISLELDNQTSRHAKFLFYIFSSDTQSKSNSTFDFAALNFWID